MFFKKSIYSLFKVLNYIIILPLFVLLKIISTFIEIRIREIPTKRIGHLTGENLNYLFQKKKETKFFLDLFFPETQICNNYLFYLFKKKMKIFPRFLLAPVLNLDNKIFKKFKITSNFNSFPKNYFLSRDIDNNLEKFQDDIKISDEDLYKGKKILKKEFGIKDDDKIVCIILRDNAYLKKISNLNYSYHNYRNVNLDAFLETVKTLIKKNYYVFRMGNVVEKNFPFKHKRFIDYPFSKINCSFMDIFLANRCEFTISSGTGWHEVPLMFNKPLILVATSLATSSSYKSNNILLTKNFYNKEGKLLNLKEIFDYRIPYFLSDADFEKNEITYEDPSESDILDTTIQMLKYLNSDFNFSEEDLYFQKKFASLFNYEEKDHQGNLFHKAVKSHYNKKILKNIFL